MSQNTEKIRRLVLLAVLTAIVLLMAFTPLGYLKLPFLEISFLMIPVVLGAILLGPAAGAVLGAVFGLTSFFQCFGMSAFGTVLLGINPVLMFLVCVPTRILAGWLSGVIFSAIFKAEEKREKRHLISFGAASLAGPILNTILFTGTLTVFFYRTDYIQELAGKLGAGNPFMFIILFVGINAVIEAAVGFIVCSVISKAVFSATRKKRVS